MTDEELEKVARDAAEAVGPRWEYRPYNYADIESGWVETTTEGRTVSVGYDGEWAEAPGRHAAAFDPATALALLERVRRAEGEAADLNERLADLERKVLCPNFEHDWAPTSADGETVVTQCRRCPASVRAVDFRPR